jgi:hypothetical protein
VGKAKRERRARQQRSIQTSIARPIDDERVYRAFGVGKPRNYFVGSSKSNTPGTWVSVSENEVYLAKKLGGEVRRLGTQHWTRPAIASLVDSLKAAAREAGVRPLRVVVRLERATVASGLTSDPLTWNGALARVLGVSISLGSLRALPSGNWLLSRDGENWEPATRETCEALDSEIRLGVPETLAHSGARALLDYWEKKK